MRRKSIKEFVQYAVVGGTCTLIDFVVLYLLTTKGGVHYLISSSLSFAIGVVLNWGLCSFWIFDFHKVQRQSTEFLYYVLISLVGLALNALLMWLFTDTCGLWFMASKLIAAGITLFYNFFARKLLLHTKR